MLSRIVPVVTPKNREKTTKLKCPVTPEVVRARKTLIKRGWSQRRAAKQLNVSYVHLCHVLTGRRQSMRLLRAISELPESPVAYQQSGFAAQH